MHRSKKKNYRKFFIYSGLLILVSLSVFVLWQLSKQVPANSDWKDTLKVLSTAEFSGNIVTVKNVRNFKYDVNGNPTVEQYYDKTYDLSAIKKVWYVTDPFHPGSPFAHTYLSFEFKNESFLAISIEGRLTKDQQYSILGGLLRTYPLMYIAADERDVLYLRTNINKDGAYVYPVRATPEQARLLLSDMLQRMNDLVVHPTWYNAIFANCTSSIADHVNKIWPGLLPRFDWQALFTNYADELALQKGLLDTTLPLDQARKKFYVTDIAQKIGYVSNFSILVRQGDRGN